MKISIKLSAPAGKLNANGGERDFHQTLKITKARQEFYTHFAEENSSNQKKLFNAANKLLGEPKQLRFPVLANDIGRYFVRKIERIRTDIDSIHLHPQDQDLVPSDGVTNRTF